MTEVCNTEIPWKIDRIDEGQFVVLVDYEWNWLCRVLEDKGQDVLNALTGNDEDPDAFDLDMGVMVMPAQDVALFNSEDLARSDEAGERVRLAFMCRPCPSSPEE